MTKAMNSSTSVYNERRELVTFAALLIIIVVSLVAAYWYDQTRPFFVNYAQQFYSWLIN